MIAAEWSAKLDRRRGFDRVSVFVSDRPVTMGEAIDGLANGPGFGEFLTRCLAAAPFEAFFWEMPPVSAATLGRPFEYVVVVAPALALMAPDRRAFADVWKRDPAAKVVAFDNISGDATLIAPTPSAPRSALAHIATFVRGAPPEQRQALFAAIGETVRATLDDRPLWISTSGLGTAWLHVRLDRRPKYYTHAPYRTWIP